MAGRRSTSISRSGAPSDFSASEVSASSPAPVDTPSSHLRILFRLSPQFLQLDCACGVAFSGCCWGSVSSGTGDGGLSASQPGHPSQSLFLSCAVARLAMLLLRLIATELAPAAVFAYSSEFNSSSGMSIKHGWYRLVDILYLAIVMTSRILFRNSMAAGGGD